MKATPEYLDFRLMPRQPGRRTDTWIVASRRTDYWLGTISWYGPWRQYTFLPSDSTRWSAGCMAAVNDFIAARMAERRP